MKGFVITATLSLLVSIHALPTPNSGATARKQGQGQCLTLNQVSQLLQTSGLSTGDLSALLQSLGAQNTGAGAGNGAQEGAAKGNGTEAAAGGEAAAGEGEAAAGEGEGEASRFILYRSCDG
jgi:hypothetical protein